MAASISKVQATCVLASPSPALTWSTTQGNLLLVAAVCYQASGSVTTPAGWTLIAQQVLGSSARPVYLFGRIALGGTSDRSTFVGSGGTTDIKGWEFSGGVPGRWSVQPQTSLTVPAAQTNANAVGTSVAAPALIGGNTNPALCFAAGGSATSTFSSFGGLPSGGDQVQPTTPNSSTTMAGGWGVMTNPTTATVTYADSTANARGIIVAAIIFQPGADMVLAS